MAPESPRSDAEIYEIIRMATGIKGVEYSSALEK